MMRIVRHGVRKLIGGGVACLFIILSPDAVRGEPEPVYPTVFLDTGGKTFQYVRNPLGGTYLGATRINEDGTVAGIWGESQLDPPWPVYKGTFAWDKQQGLRAVYTLPAQGRRFLKQIHARWVLLLDTENTGVRRYFLWSEQTGEVALPLPGERRARIVAVNAGGTAVVVDSMKGLVWTKEKGLTEIGVPLQGRRESILPLNDAGVLLGQTNTEAFVWSEQTGVTPLGEGTVAGLLNEQGLVAGKIKPEGADGWALFLWTREKGLEVLAPFKGTKSMAVSALTETGMVFGTIQYPGDRGGAVFRWSRKSGMEVSPAFGERKRVEIVDWTGAGVVIGNIFADNATGSPWEPRQPFVWHPGNAPELLPMPEGVTNASAKKINDHGQIIGGFRTANTRGKFFRSWVWTREAGYRELDIKMPWKESEVIGGHWGVYATDINNAGQIVGGWSLYEMMLDDGDSRSFMRQSAVLWEVPPPGKQAGGVAPAEQVPEKTTPPR